MIHNIGPIIGLDYLYTRFYICCTYFMIVYSISSFKTTLNSFPLMQQNKTDSAFPFCFVSLSFTHNLYSIICFFLRKSYIHCTAFQRHKKFCIFCKRYHCSGMLKQDIFILRQLMRKHDFTSVLPSILDGHSVPAFLLFSQFSFPFASHKVCKHK